jgi:rRNA processing protein Gar1
LSTKETRERTRKILSAIQQIVDVVGPVAELSPYAKVRPYAELPKITVVSIVFVGGRRRVYGRDLAGD